MIQAFWGTTGDGSFERATDGWMGRFRGCLLFLQSKQFCFKLCSGWSFCVNGQLRSCCRRQYVMEPSSNMAGVLTRWRERPVGEGSSRKTEAEIEAATANKHQGWSSKSFRRSTALPTPWFCTFNFLNYETIHFCCVRPPNLWYHATLEN